MRNIPVGHASDERSGRPPTAEEKVICPQPSPVFQRNQHPPERVYESKDSNGKPVTRGILSPHKHWGYSEECPWSGHPVDVIRVPKSPSAAPGGKVGAGD